ncbi:hypothetical protein C2S51_025736 [Perilla frutescens var. frutescens]|nr:hypothetical protein C2S51_025736 [Perilla frutescens var. frutescens]
MADNTRFKDLFETQKKLDQILQTETLKREVTETRMEEKFEGMNTDMQGKFEYLTKLMAELRLELLKGNKGKEFVVGESILGEPPPSGATESAANHQGKPVYRHATSWDSQNSQVINPLPKIDFPRFDGSLARSWIIKCNGYFNMVPNLSDGQKITLATMQFEGKAAQWYQNLAARGLDLTWQQFLEVISARFDDLKETKIICEFNKLKHTGSYEDYVERFEELRACMGLLHPGEFTESYYMASFLSGLGEELKSAVLMFKPKDLQHIIELGQSQLLTIEVISRKLKGTNRGYTSNNSSFPRSAISNTFSKGDTHLPNPPKAPIRLLTANKMAERRQQDQGLHEGVGKETGELMEETQLSLNALTGSEGLTTMRFNGSYENHPLQILIDTGSTLSFIKGTTAEKLGIPIKTINSLLIKEVVDTYIDDPFCQKVITSKEGDHTLYPDFTFTEGLLRHKGKVVVGHNKELKQKILDIMHGSPYGGHSGINGTYIRLKRSFY